MATVMAKVSGGTVKEYTVSTLGELKSLLNVKGYTATVNKETESDDNFKLEADDIVIFSPAVKGAQYRHGDVITRKAV